MAPDNNEEALNFYKNLKSQNKTDKLIEMMLSSKFNADYNTIKALYDERIIETAKTTTPTESLKLEDFNKPYNDIRLTISKLTDQEIINGKFIEHAAQLNNLDVLNSLLQRVAALTKEKNSTLAGKKEPILETAFTLFLANAYNFATQYNNQLEEAKNTKSLIEKENMEIESLDTIKELDKKIQALELNRNKLNEDVKKIQNNASIVRVKNKKIKKILKEFLQQSRIEVTEQAEKEYKKYYELSAENNKQLGNTIAKFSQAGLNFNSDAVIKILDKQNGVMRGEAQKDTINKVKSFIAMAKASNRLSKVEVTSSKKEKIINLADAPPILSEKLILAVTEYKDTSKDKKSDKKEAMLTTLYNELTKRNAELLALKEYLADKNLKNNLEQYINESNEYQIYKALGVEKGVTPSMPMQMEGKNIILELQECIREEQAADSDKKYEQHKDRAEERVKQILYEMGISSKITGIDGSRVQQEQQDSIAKNISTITTEESQESPAVLEQKQHSTAIDASIFNSSGLSEEEFNKATKLYQMQSKNPNIRNMLLARYPSISTAQLSALGLEKEDKPITKTINIVKTPAQELTSADFAKSLNELENSIVKLTPQQIIEGNFLEAAAKFNNPETVAKLVEQFKKPPKESKTLPTSEKQAALENGFIALLTNAHNIATKHDKELIKATNNKKDIDRENLEIANLTDLNKINSRINNLGADRKLLDEKINNIKNRDDIERIKSKEINKISKEFLQQSREEITKQADQEYNNIALLSNKNKKNLNNAISKYAEAGINFNSKQIIDALNAHKGVMQGNAQIDTRKQVASAIATARQTQKNFATDKQDLLVKKDKVSNLIAEPPKLDDKLEQAIKSYNTADKEQKLNKKEEMLDCLYESLTKKNAELIALKDHLPDGELKDDLDSYIQESNHYRIYNALGLEKDKQPDIAMQLNYKNISKELELCIQEELQEKRQNYEIHPKEAKTRVKEIFAELGIKQSIIDNSVDNDMYFDTRTGEELEFFDTHDNPDLLILDDVNTKIEKTKAKEHYNVKDHVFRKKRSELINSEELKPILDMIKRKKQSAVSDDEILPDIENLFQLSDDNKLPQELTIEPDTTNNSKDKEQKLDNNAGKQAKQNNKSDSFLSKIKNTYNKIKSFIIQLMNFSYNESATAEDIIKISNEQTAPDQYHVDINNVVPAPTPNKNKVKRASR
jgi:hypothetical protein